MMTKADLKKKKKQSSEKKEVENLTLFGTEDLRRAPEPRDTDF